MKTIEKLLSILVILNLINSNNIFSQDIHFSQFYENPLVFNPAQAGDFLGNHRVGMIYRNQWNTVTIPYSTFGVYYDCALFDRKWQSDYMGFGANVYKDQAGDAKMGTTNASISLSYFLSLSPENTIGLGAQTAYVQRSCDMTQIRWDSQFNGAYFDASLPSQENFFNESFNYFDFSAGLTWSYAQPSKINAFRSTVGIAAYHLNTAEQNFLALEQNGKPQNIRIAFFATAEAANKKTNIYYIPSIFYQRQGPLQEFVAGGLLGFQLNEGSRITGWIRESSFYIGGYYRYADALIIATTLQLHSYSLSFAYDFNVSDLAPASNNLGGFEVSIVYKTPYIPRWKKGKSRY